MSENEARAVAQALLDHPDHELYDEAPPGEVDSLERFLRIRLPPSYRILLETGSGGVLANGDLLLGTKDPEQLGATVQEVARASWAEGLERRYLPVIDGERLIVLDLDRRDAEGECAVVELDAESLEPIRRWDAFPRFAREVLLR